jgi:hypothetical protein
MKATSRPLTEVNQQATKILIRELGVVDAQRFLGQFRVSSGDYTKQRGEWLDHLTLEQILSEIIAKRRKRRRPAPSLKTKRANHRR